MRSFYAMPAASHKEMLTHNYIVFTNERPIVRIYVCFSGTSLSCNSPTLSSSSPLYVFLVYLCPIMPLESLKAIAAAVSYMGRMGNSVSREAAAYIRIWARACVYLYTGRDERGIFSAKWVASVSLCFASEVTTDYLLLDGCIFLLWRSAVNGFITRSKLLLDYLY